MSDLVLSVQDLTVRYSTRQGDVKAVEKASFTVRRGESLGLVGESGCGKTTIALALLRLLPDNGRITGGHIYLDGADLVSMDYDQVRRYRWRRIAMIFQAAMNSLDPVYRVGDQIIEAITLHYNVSEEEARSRVARLFRLVGLDPSLADRYPHEFSGGMKQRAIIAMALSCDPEVVIADEPTTALDVIVQDRILREISQVQRDLNMGMVYISHDIAVIAEVCDNLAVMYAGHIVERGSTVEVFRSPIHPYTQALISSFPSVAGQKHELVPLPGEPPSLVDPPAGCPFHPRCPLATEECRTQEPPLVRRGTHEAYCWNPLEEKRDGE